MPYQFLIIPFKEEDGVFEDAAFKAIEEKCRIIKCEVSFFQTTRNAYWTAMVEFESKEGGITYVVPLDEAGKQRFEILRQWRNAQAESDGLPPYVIASNKQLQLMAQLETPSLEAIKAVKGFGAAKAEKYGKVILTQLLQSKATHETP